MKFDDPFLRFGEFRRQFLIYLDEITPEFKIELEALRPSYQEACKLLNLSSHDSDVSFGEFREAFLAYLNENAPNRTSRDPVMSYQEFCQYFAVYLSENGPVVDDDNINCMCLLYNDLNNPSQDTINELQRYFSLQHLFTIYERRIIIAGVFDGSANLPHLVNSVENYAGIAPPETHKDLDYLLSFRQRFDDLIIKHNLNTKTNWLRIHLFRFLGKIGVDSVSSGYIPKTASPDYHRNFIFREPYWQLKETWESFERRTKKSFESMLAEYKADAKHFYSEVMSCKLKTKPVSTDSVKWLIHWTVLRTDKESILRMIAKERPSTMTVDDLNRVFRDLERNYDLPLRRVRSRSKKGKSSQK